MLETESTTCAANVEIPACDATPLMFPFAASTSPFGSEPDAILHIYGGVPPVAARVAEYGVPTPAWEIVAVEIASTGALAPLRKTSPVATIPAGA